MYGMRQKPARDRMMRVAGPDWCSIHSNVIRKREKLPWRGADREGKCWKCMGDNSASREDAEWWNGKWWGVKGECGGVCGTCQLAKGDRQKFEAKRSVRGWEWMEGIGEVPGPWHCHKQQHRHLRSLTWIFSTTPSLSRAPHYSTILPLRLLPTWRHTAHYPCAMFSFPFFYSPLHETKTSWKHKIAPQNSFS